MNADNKQPMTFRFKREGRTAPRDGADKKLAGEIRKQTKELRSDMRPLLDDLKRWGLLGIYDL